MSVSGRVAGYDAEHVQHGMQSEPYLHFGPEAVMCGRALGQSAQQPLKHRTRHCGGWGGVVVGGGDGGCGGAEGDVAGGSGICGGGGS